MAPPSTHQTRPPLASRLRASFELKRSKSRNKGHSHSDSLSEDIVSPTAESNGSPNIPNGFLSGPGGQDGDTLRIAIDQAISSDAFQSAIAAHLAKLIKPSIKSALDTIQPLVEAVYTHEILLRKTNQNVEDALERIETTTNASRRVSRIDPDGGGELGEHRIAEEVPATREIPAASANPDLNHFKQLLEDHNTHNTSTLAGLSASIENTNAKIAEVAEGVADIKGTFGPGIETLTKSTEESSTTISALQAQLDQLKTDVAQILEAVGSDLGKNVQAIHERGVTATDTSVSSEHITKLDAISADIAALKEHPDTMVRFDSISTELASLKDAVQGSGTVSSEGFASVGAQLASVISAIEGHTTVLGEIKESPPHPELVAAIQQSNDSHALHSTSLAELKERSVGVSPSAEVGSSVDNSEVLSGLRSDLAALKENIETGLNSHGENLTGLGAKIDTISSTIEGHQASDTSAEILAAVQQSNESHISHATALEGLKSGDGDSAGALDLAPLHTEVSGIVSALAMHSTILDEIKVAHTTHALALDDIKSRTLEHGTMLEEIRSPGLPPVAPRGFPTPDASNLAALEIQVGSIVTTLSTHTAALADIGFKVGASNASTLSADTENPSLGDLTTVLEILDAHTAILNEIKEDVSAEILTAIHNIDQKQENCANLLVEVREGDVSEEVLTLLHGVGETANSHATDLQSLREVVQASHGTLEELKSKDVDVTAPTAVDLSPLEAQITALHSLLSEHKETLASIKEATAASHDLHISHGSSLEEIKSRSLEPAAVPDIVLPSFGGIESKLDNLALALDEHKETLSSIKDTTTASHDLHITHGSSIDEIKSRSLESAPPVTEVPSFEGIEAKLDSLIASLDEHKTTLAVIKESTIASQESHALHTAAFDDLKSRSVEPTPGTNMPSFEGMESKIDTLISTFDEHKSTLASIRDTTSASHDLHASHTTSLDEIKSRSVEAPDFSAFESQLGGIVTSLEEHKTLLGAIQESHNAQTSSLDNIKANSSEPAPAADFSGLDAQLAGIVASLEEHKVMLSTIQELHTSHATSLDEIKSRSVDAAPVEAPGLAGLETQIGGVIASLEGHKTILSSIQELHGAQASSIDELKAKSIDLEHVNDILASLEEHKVLLATIQEKTSASHDLHIAHGTSLDELKAKSVDPEHIGSILTGLEEHKSSLATIQEKTLASHDLHVAHSISLDEIKSRSMDSTSEAQPAANIEGLESHITGIVAALDEHKAILSELKDTTAGLAENHTAHTAILGEIKDSNVQSNESHASHAVVLSELKAVPAPASPDLSAMEAHLNIIITTLESQTETLSSLKEGPSIAEVHETIKQSHELLTTNHELLSSHSTLLSEIKESNSHEDITSSLVEIKTLITDSKSEIGSHGELVKDLHSSTKESHSSLTTAIAALAIGGTAGAGATALLTDDNDSSSDVMSELKIVRSIVEGSKEDIESLKSQLDAHSTTVTTSLSSLGDDIKTEIGTSGASTVEAVAAVHGDVKSIDLAPIHTAIGQHGTDVKGMAVQLEGIDGSVKAIDLSTIHSVLEQHGTEVKNLAVQLEGIEGGVKGLDLAPIHATLEQHGTDFKTLSTQVEEMDGNVKALDLTPLHASLEQHGDEVKGLVTQLETIDGSVKAIDLASIHSALEQHGTALEQHGANVQDISTHLENLDLAPLHAALELHGAGIDGIYTQLGSLDGSVKETGSHVLALHDGVHFNESGIQQLQSHAISRQVAPAEGAWFKRDKSPSPVLEKSNPAGHKDKHSSIPAALAGVLAGGVAVAGAAALLSDDDEKVDEEQPDFESSLEESIVETAVEAETPTEQAAELSPIVEESESLVEDDSTGDKSLGSAPAIQESGSPAAIDSNAEEVVHEAPVIEDSGLPAEADSPREKASVVAESESPVMVDSLEEVADSLPVTEEGELLSSEDEVPAVDVGEETNADEPQESVETSPIVEESELPVQFDMSGDDIIESASVHTEGELPAEADAFEEEAGESLTVVEQNELQIEGDTAREELDATSAVVEDNGPLGLKVVEEGSPKAESSEETKVDNSPFEEYDSDPIGKESLPEEIHESKTIDDTPPAEPESPIAEAIEASDDIELYEEPLQSEHAGEPDSNEDLTPIIDGEHSAELEELPVVAEIVEDSSLGDNEIGDDAQSQVASEAQDEIIEAKEVAEPESTPPVENDALPISFPDAGIQEDKSLDEADTKDELLGEDEIVDSKEVIEPEPTLQDEASTESQELDSTDETHEDPSIQASDAREDSSFQEEVIQPKEPTESEPEFSESSHETDGKTPTDAGTLHAVEEDHPLPETLDDSTSSPEDKSSALDEKSEEAEVDTNLDILDGPSSPEPAQEDLPTVEILPILDPVLEDGQNSIDDSDLKENPQSNDEDLDLDSESLELVENDSVDEPSAGMEVEESSDVRGQTEISEMLDLPSDEDVPGVLSVQHNLNVPQEVAHLDSGPEEIQDPIDQLNEISSVVADTLPTDNTTDTEEEVFSNSPADQDDDTVTSHEPANEEPHLQGHELEIASSESELPLLDEESLPVDKKLPAEHHEDQEISDDDEPDVKGLPLDENHSIADSKQDKGEIDSQGLDDLAHDTSIGGIEDPFSDAPASDSLPPHPQVQSFSYTSPLSNLSHMSESYNQEPQLRETASSQLGYTHEINSPGFEEQEPVSSPFIDSTRDLVSGEQYPQTPSRNPFPIHSSLPPFTSQSPYPTYQQTRQQSSSQSYPIDGHEVGADVESLPSSPAANLPQLSQFSTAVHSSEADYSQQHKSSRPTSASSGFAFDSFSHDVVSPIADADHKPSSPDMEDFDFQPRNLDLEYGRSSRALPEIPKTQAFEPVARQGEGYSRRSTMEDHAAPTSAPGAGFYAPSATESHCSVSEHTNEDTDPFAPMYDAYSPTDVVNDYADYTPSAYGQTPGAGRDAYFDGIPETQSISISRRQTDENDIATPTTIPQHDQYFETAPVPDLYSSHRSISPLAASRSPPPIPQHSSYLSHVDQQYTQQETDRPNFTVPVQSSQYAQYAGEISSAEPSPYSQDGLLEREYNRTDTRQTHNARSPRDSDMLSSIQDRYASSPEPEYIAPRDERYMQELVPGQRREYVPSPISNAYEFQYEDEDEAEEDYSPPNTGSFQQSFSSTNPFAAPATQPAFPTLTPGRGRRQPENFMSPIRDEQQEEYYPEDAASVQQRFVPMDLPQGRYRGSISPARNEQSNRFFADDMTATGSLPRELPQRSYEQDFANSISNARLSEVYDGEESGVHFAEARVLQRQLPQREVSSRGVRQTGYGGFDESVVPRRDVQDAGYGGFEVPEVPTSSRRGVDPPVTRSSQRGIYEQYEEEEEEEEEEEFVSHTETGRSRD